MSVARRPSVRVSILLLALAFVVMLLSRPAEGSRCQPTPTLEPGAGVGIHLTPSWYPTTTPLPYAVWVPVVRQDEGCQ